MERNAAELRREILDIQISPPRRLAGEQLPLASHILVFESAPVGGLVVSPRNLSTQPRLKEALVGVAEFRNFSGF
jgi:hypothetical protein